MFKKLAFVGAGSMAESIMSGILAKKMMTADQIYVTNKNNKERLDRLEKVYQVHCSSSKKEVVEDADIIILSMKPKDICAALESIRLLIKEDQLIVSVLAGISTDYISEQLGMRNPVVRAMPNTSAAVGYSATAIAAGQFAENDHIRTVQELFGTIGTTTVVDEEDLHTVTGLSGSGPAYVYYLAEAMEKAATDAGLEKDVAKELIVQTLMGAAEMLKNTHEDPAVLRHKVTSPGGTTQAGLETLDQYHFRDAMMACIKSASLRSTELGNAFESQK